MKSGLAVAGKVAAVGIGAAATAVTALSKLALDSTGELEQNIGGSEAVFKEHATSMQKTAETAYDKMGLSASNFLATANKMGALMQGSGLSIEQSASLSAQAMQRAADVASIMGIDVTFAMESVAGAAKGNFTMMDNLGVAMNATTLEAYALSKGITTAYAKMDNATKVQLAMEMFLEKTTYAAGNYAKENETLAGSMTTLKASWDNWLSGAGDMNALLDSTMNAGRVIGQNLKEIMPRLAEGIGEAITFIATEIPTVVSQALPQIAAVGTSVISTLGAAITENAPIILEGIVNTFNTALNALAENLPMIVDTVLQALGGMIEGFSTTGVELITSLINGILSAIPTLVAALPQLITSIVNFIISSLPTIINAGIQIILALIQGVSQTIPQLVNMMPQLISQLANAVMSGAKSLVSAGKAIVENIKSGISAAWSSVTSMVSSLVSSLKSALSIDIPITVSNAPSKINGSHAGGLDYVPFDGYIAELHKGERVLTAAEAKGYNKPSVSIVQYIYSTAKTAADLMEEAQYQAERAVLLGV